MMCLFTDDLDVPFERRSGLDRNAGGTSLQVPQGLQQGRCTAWAHRTGSQRAKGAPPTWITLPVFSQIPQAPSWVGLVLPANQAC